MPDVARTDCPAPNQLSMCGLGRDSTYLGSRGDPSSPEPASARGRAMCSGLHARIIAEWASSDAASSLNGTQPWLVAIASSAGPGKS